MILYDGKCGFCIRSVDFIRKRDRKGRFRFVALESEEGEGLLRDRGIAPESVNSLVLIEGEETLFAADAVIKIACRLQRWKWGGALLSILPRGLRNRAYAWVARHRYHLDFKH
ncbi:MAG: thiol-disulfide oxidoreductase DCC family protein [Planctomycetota bacterium]